MTSVHYKFLCDSLGDEINILLSKINAETENEDDTKIEITDEWEKKLFLMSN